MPTPRRKPAPLTGDDVVHIVRDVIEGDRESCHVTESVSPPMPRIAVVGLRISQLQARRTALEQEEEHLQTRLDAVEAEKASITTEQQELARELDRLSVARALSV